MIIEFYSRSEKTKTLKFTNNSEVVLLTLRYVAKVDKEDEVQAASLEHRGSVYLTWKQHGSLLILLGNCLGTKFDTSHGTRKKYFDEWWKKYD